MKTSKTTAVFPNKSSQLDKANAVDKNGSIDQAWLIAFIDQALEEDLGKNNEPGDITSRAIIPIDKKAQAGVLYKEQAIVCGLNIFAFVFKHFDDTLKFEQFIEEGSFVSPYTKVAQVSGSARSILTSERLALNLLQRLSGIATTTKQYADRARPLGIAIKDTRKTTPNLRALEKYAVTIGSGVNHRFGLFDQILIKDNHIAVAGGVRQAIILAKQAIANQDLSPNTTNSGKPVFIEVEVTNLEELAQALEQDVDAVLLDNMQRPLIEQCVQLVAGRCHIEVSGGVNLNNLDSYLIPGVNSISIGALTHSTKNIDISLEVEI